MGLSKAGLDCNLWPKMYRQIRRGTLGDAQYCNTVRKIGKYRNTVLKIDEIQIPHLWSVTLNYLTLYPSCVFFISSMHTPEINLSLCEKMWDLKLIGTTIEKPGHWMTYQFRDRVTVRNCGQKRSETGEAK